MPEPRFPLRFYIAYVTLYNKWRISNGLAALVSPRTPGSLANQIAPFLYKNTFNSTNIIIIIKTRPLLTQSNLVFFAPVNRGPSAAIPSQIASDLL
jgi:hypothetical protein